MSPPRSGSNFLQQLLSSFLKQSKQTTTYHNQTPFSEDILLVKSHADCYIRLINEVSCLEGYPPFPSKFLLIVRDPRLSTISSYEYSGRSYNKDQKEYLYAPNHGSESPGLCRANYMVYLKEFYTHWLNYCNKTKSLIIKFEELINDISTFLKVIDYLGQGDNLKLVDDKIYLDEIKNISYKLEIKWKSLSRNPSKSVKKLFPYKQYKSEFGNISDYQIIVKAVENDMGDLLSELAYTKELFD